MPDRDFVSTHVRTPWRPVARLWDREGASVAMVDRAMQALAKVLRDGSILLDRARIESARSARDLTPDERESRALRILIYQAVLAPMRGRLLMTLDFQTLARREARALAALAPEIDRQVAAMAAGRRPRVSRRARPDVRRILETPVSIQL